MRAGNWIFVIILFSIVSIEFSFIRPQESPPPNGLKVMTYNIWNGFDWGKDTARKQNLIKWIQDKDPDVVALQELCGYDEEKLKADAAKWGHSYAKILKTGGYPVGLTSKKPITVKERATDGLWHGMLHCETYGIEFFVVHLSPADCDFRLKEAAIIAEKVLNTQSDQYIILGDFNSHSPFDGEVLKQNQKLLEKYLKGVSEKYSNLRLGEYDYSVVSRFMALPAIDIGEKFIDIKDRFTFPTPVLIGSYIKTMNDVTQTRERIDYILTSPVIAKSCIKARIYNKGEAETFSDHYPMMAEFAFKPH